MTSFEDRQKDLFNQLNAAEKQADFINRARSNQVDNEDGGPIRQHVRRTKAEMKQFRGKESIFKRPEAPLSHCLRSRKVPGYQKNPQKWICYNLENVPTVSDRSNAEAAAVCLKEVELQKISEDPMDEDDAKVTFKPPVKDSKNNIVGEVSESKPSDKEVTYTNSKITLPQYFVGRKEKVSKPKKERTESDTPQQAQLRLEHLHDEDDE